MGVWEGVSTVVTGANASSNTKRLPNLHIYEVTGNILTQNQMVAKGAAVVNTAELRFEDGGKTRIEIVKSAPGQPVSETVRRYRRLE